MLCELKNPFCLTEMKILLSMYTMDYRRPCYCSYVRENLFVESTYNLDGRVFRMICCCQPIFCARLLSWLLPTHLSYLVKSRLSWALLPTHLDYGLFALLLPTHLPKRGLATAIQQQTQPSRLYMAE